ncbi:MAG: CocE/NonD family hydrolase [Nocardioides sp.]|uniref:CocE/NonD family hydrolase n=1 Tax=Nocardioides sp. TaxID=35761 RepID=UPI0039E4BCD5
MVSTVTTREVRIRMADGVELAATLYLPDEAAGPQPCLLEALPYRKDDLTSSYAPSYVSLCENHQYAVCRLDLRGTGSSGGNATDEYPEAEQHDLAEVIAWLAAQEWCDGNVGMWGTSYSGFNSLQMACEQPPALKAICAIFATDDRWTDDVHWRGAALRLVDLVDYCTYMTPMCVLPPVPALWGDGWEEEWHRRLRTNEPWVLTWLRENRHGAYWNHGSVRLDGTTRGYERIACPTMIVAGWADGYRNNSFRTIAELAEHDVPHRLLAGPWAHDDATTAMPGPRIDLETELVAWFDRWLRNRGEHTDGCDVFVRSSTRPEPDLDMHEGWWLRLPSVPPVTPTGVPLPGPRELVVRPDVGTTAWIDCAGHLPWGLSGDQRIDDARSLTWDSAPPTEPVVGYPRAKLRLASSEPLASLSVKLCDAFPDGTSALVSRGTVDLAYRGSVHGGAQPLEPGVPIDVEVDLDACAYAWTPGNQLRISIAGADWPNTIAPPAPLTLTVLDGTLELPVLTGDHPAPVFVPGAEHSTESAEGIGWEIHHDVLTRRVCAVTRSDSSYETPYDGHARELYEGQVSVDTRTFDQHAHADTLYELGWPGIEITMHTVMDVEVRAEGYDVTIETVATRDGAEVSRRSWHEQIPR